MDSKKSVQLYSALKNDIRFSAEKDRLRLKSLAEALSEVDEIQQEEAAHRARLALVDWTSEDREATANRAARLKRIYTTQVNALKALIEAALAQERDSALKLFEIEEQEPADQDAPALKTAVDVAGRIVEVEQVDPHQLKQQVRELLDQLPVECLSALGDPPASQMDRPFLYSRETSLLMAEFEQMAFRWLESQGVKIPNHIMIKTNPALKCLIEREAAAKGEEEPQAVAV